MDKKGSEKIESQETEKKENIEILWMDELYTCVKKKRIKSEFGLLSIGMRSISPLTAEMFLLTYPKKFL